MMKRIVACIVSMVVLCSTITVFAEKQYLYDTLDGDLPFEEDESEWIPTAAAISEAALSVGGKSAVLMEQKTGAVLFEKNMHEKLPIASVTKIPMDKHLLIRNKDIETQTHKGNYERWENVRNVFECLSPEKLSDKHILLVDDVLTTGATIVACADALGKIPGLRISVLTLAWAGST